VLVIAITLIALHTAAFLGVLALSRHSVLLVDEQGYVLLPEARWSEQVIAPVADAEALEV
jgi:hypothetical protein